MTRNYAIFSRHDDRIAERLISLAGSENEARRIVKQAEPNGAKCYEVRYWVGLHNCGRWVTLCTIQPTNDEVIQ